MYYLGIDQHAKHLTTCLYDEAGTLVKKRQVGTRPDKVSKFFDEELPGLVGEDQYASVLEVCGFNDWLLDRLEVAPRSKTVVLVQPVDASRRKTDRRDAAKLADTLWLNRERLLLGLRVRGLRQVAIASKTQRVERQLTQRRRELGASRTRVINKIKNLLQRDNLQHDLPSENFKTLKARRWLETVKLDYYKRLVLDQLLAEMRLLDEHITQVQRHLEKLLEHNRTAQIVASLPGAAAYSALAIASRIGPISRFATADSLANFLGVTPSCHNSGQKTQRLGGITKAGSSMVRFLLGQLVTHLLRVDEGLKRWHGRLRNKRGAKVARVAVMRKIACSLWHMLTYEEPYIPLDERRPRPSPPRLT